ncbi:MAG: hypothetical protein DMG88_22740 [Acidobacteria bacterium]|jgi:hypothetical protein|nr:MAG: hypothetical protein DMG88_22740 [Acidobacteriota bacterium]
MEKESLSKEQLRQEAAHVERRELNRGCCYFKSETIFGPAGKLMPDAKAALRNAAIRGKRKAHDLT